MVPISKNKLKSGVLYNCIKYQSDTTQTTKCTKFNIFSNNFIGDNNIIINNDPPVPAAVDVRTVSLVQQIHVYSLLSIHLLFVSLQWMD